jgi:MSHA biogenesis protein MshK
MRRSTFALLFLCATVLAPQGAYGQQLRDPTRPPVFMVPGGPAAARESDLVLQTVLISPERRAAIINGQLLRLGESIAGMQLMSISEGEVQLRGRGESRTLHLFPAIDKRHVKPAEIAGGG